jgi:hypothetical protein
MDNVGLRELINSGVRTAKDAWVEPGRGGDDSQEAIESRVGTILDRLAQLGVVALEHEADWLLEHLISGLLDIYRLGLPDNARTWHPDRRQARWMLAVNYRVYLLGTVAMNSTRWSALRRLVVQCPIERHASQYWMRYTVTMASRGELKDMFQGKSLIGPMSEFVQARPQFYGLFDANLDVVVNSLCRFDFLACVVTVAATEDVDNCYPNFGGYYSYRTLPIIHRLLADPKLRNGLLPDVDDELLAEVLDAIGEMTPRWFFEVVGWEGYDDQVRDFISAHLPSGA